MAKKDITITLDLDEIVYDIQNSTYLIARGKQDVRERADTQATDDDESLNHIRRRVGNAVARVKKLVSEWGVSGPVVADNTLPPGKGCVTLILPMPTNYNDGATQDLTSAMHQYVSDMATASWLNDVSPADSTRYYKLSDEHVVQIKDAILRRKRPSRRPYHECDCGGGGVTPTDGYLWLDNGLWLDNELWTEHA